MCYDADHMGLSSYTTPSTVSLTCSIIIQPPPTSFFFFFNDTATTEIYTLSLHDALPICERAEPPHVDQPVYAGHRFETKRRQDRKSTRLNSSHSQISYAVFCLKKKKKTSEPRDARLHPSQSARMNGATPVLERRTQDARR